MPDNNSPEINPHAEKREVLELVKRMDALIENANKLPPQKMKGMHGSEILNDKTILYRTSELIPFQLMTDTSQININEKSASIIFRSINLKQREMLTAAWGEKLSAEFLSGLKYEMEISEGASSDDKPSKSIEGIYYISSNGEIVKTNVINTTEEIQGDVISGDASHKEERAELSSMHYEGLGFALQILEKTIDRAGKQE